MAKFPAAFPAHSPLWLNNPPSAPNAIKSVTTVAGNLMREVRDGELANAADLHRRSVSTLDVKRVKHTDTLERVSRNHGYTSWADLKSKARDENGAEAPTVAYPDRVDLRDMVKSVVSHAMEGGWEKTASARELGFERTPDAIVVDLEQIESVAQARDQRSNTLILGALYTGGQVTLDQLCLDTATRSERRVLFRNAHPSAQQREELFGDKSPVVRGEIDIINIDYLQNIAGDVDYIRRLLHLLRHNEILSLDGRTYPTECILNCVLDVPAVELSELDSPLREFADEFIQEHAVIHRRGVLEVPERLPVFIASQLAKLTITKPEAQPVIESVSTLTGQQLNEVAASLGHREFVALGNLTTLAVDRECWDTAIVEYRGP